MIDASILSEMSKWSMVTSKTDEATMALRRQGPLMASTIRHQEEKALLDRFGQSPEFVKGRLTDKQLTALLDKASFATSQQHGALAKEFDLIGEAQVEAILKCVTRAVIVVRKDGIKMATR